MKAPMEITFSRPVLCLAIVVGLVVLAIMAKGRGD